MKGGSKGYKLKTNIGTVSMYLWVFIIKLINIYMILF